MINIETSSERLTVRSESWGTAIALGCGAAILMVLSFIVAFVLDPGAAGAMRGCALIFLIAAPLAVSRLDTIFDASTMTATRTRSCPMVPFLPGLNNTKIFDLRTNIGLRTQHTQHEGRSRHFVQIAQENALFFWSIHKGSIGDAKSRELERTIREWLHFARHDSDLGEPPMDETQLATSNA